MILISLRGGTKTQRNLTEDAARYFIKQLLPRHRSLSVDIHIHNILKEDAAGYCLQVNRKEFEIELHNRGTLYEYLSYLAHELVHLKQYALGELRFKYMKQYWMGEDMTGLNYNKQPWEVEAWDLQYKLVKEYIKSETDYTIKASKDLSPRTLKKVNWQMEFDIMDRYSFDDE